MLRPPARVITIASGALAASLVAAIGAGTSISLGSTGFVGAILDARAGPACLGGSYSLNGLTAVLLGGMALKMGKPNVLGTLAAIVFLVGFLNGAALLGWTDSRSQIVRGLLLLISVGLIVFANERSHRARRG